MTLVVIRHLPTAWNLSERLQGRADIAIAPPDSKELEVIQENRTKLSLLGPFDKIICSNLQRTRQSAEIYGYENPMCEPLLAELDFGRYEGALRKEMLAEIGDAWTNSPQTLELGESISQLEKRVRDFLVNYNQHKRVLVFGHGCWCRALKSIHETGNVNAMNQLTVRNNEVLVLDFEPKLLSDEN